MRGTGAWARGLAAGAVLLALVGGCGEEEAQSLPEVASADQGATCAGSAAAESARSVASVDFDGDGAREPVVLTAHGGGCGDVLLVEIGGAPHGLRAPALAPMDGASRAVRLPGRKGELLLVEQGRTGGGYQPRLFGYAGGALAELREGDRPVLPFVATDATVIPYSVRCATKGFVMNRAVTHEPAGVVFAWDVERTDYRIKGTRVARGGSREIADSVLPDRLGEQYPELARHDLFADCG